MIEENSAFSDLPYVVKRYLRKALQRSDEQAESHPVPQIQALKFQQQGSFLIQGIWVPFTATQYISAMEPIGFLWDSTMLMPSPWGFDMPVSVRDVYFKGKGSLEASFGHVLTLVNLHDNPEIDLGEQQRWLAESVLIPSALLPSKQIQWHPVIGHETQAQLVMNETVSGAVAEMIMEFGPDGLASSIYAKRPKNSEDGSGKIEIADWVGKVSEYKKDSGLLIPTRMEAGWRNEQTGELELYFTGESFGFEYIFS
jgi:hypothetical protein